MKEVFKLILGVVIAIHLYSCANVQPLDGGPEETQPPGLLYSLPKTNSANVDINVKKISLHFDESVLISNLSSEVIINPYYDLANFKAVAKGDKIDLVFKDELLPNTTYSINFGKAITDVNERTPLINYTYSFSTGSIIDTLTYSAVIRNNITHKVLENVSVGLYANATTRPDTTKPLYITKTLKDGSFTFNSLPNRSFKLYAFEDKNTNRLIDLNKEAFGFNPLLILPSNQSGDTIELFKARPELNKLLAPVSKANYLDINFSYGIKTITKTSITPYQLLNNNSTLRLYPSLRDSTVSISVTDSSDYVIDTTINLNYRPKIYSDTLIDLKTHSVIDPKTINTYLYVQLPYLYESIDTSLIYNVSKGDTLPLSRSTNNLSYKSDDNIIIFSSDNETDTINIVIDKQAITFLTGQQNKLFRSYKIKPTPNNYGSIKGDIKTEEKNYVVYLMDENKKILFQETNNAQIDYTYLTPGTYHIKILIDKNGNGSYDTGTLTREAEHYYFNQNSLIVKKGWDMGNIHISF